MNAIAFSIRISICGLSKMMGEICDKNDLHYSKESIQ